MVVYIQWFWLSPMGGIPFFLHYSDVAEWSFLGFPFTIFHEQHEASA